GAHALSRPALPYPEACQALGSLDRAELARLLVPFARGGDIGLQADHLELGQLVRVVGARERHGALRQPDVDGALEELARGKDVAALELLHALGVQSQRP